MDKRAGVLGRCVAVSALVAALSLSAMGPQAHASSLSLTTITQMANWYPQPEIGGMFTADTLGYYKQAGLNERILPFDSKVDIPTMVAQGKASFAITDAGALFAARASGLHVVAVMNTMQINPQGLLWYSNEDIHSLADLSGHVVIRTPSVWWDYLVQKFHYKNVTSLDDDYTFKLFLSHPNAVLQCYVTSEPYTLHSMGKNIHWTLLADSGFDPYPELVITSDAMLRDHPDTVQAYVQATLRGWQTYMNDPASTLAVLEKYPDAKNYPLTPNAMLFSYLHLVSLVTGGEAKLHGLGTMSKARFDELYAQLLSVHSSFSNFSADQSHAMLQKLDPDTTYTLRFVPH